MNKTDYHELKKRILEREFAALNPSQREAVFKTVGPALVLAGAGSGKTTVLVNKIAYMIKYGDAYHSGAAPQLSESEEELLRLYADDPKPEHAQLVQDIIKVDPIAPWSILAITFSNKAANELKERIVKMIPDGGSDIWASTFHAACLRILRKEGEKLGLASGFAIYDTDDSKRIVKECMRTLEISDRVFTPGGLLGAISREKDKLHTVADLQKAAAESGDYTMSVIAGVYDMYQKLLTANNALDFDDIILKTVQLLRGDEQTLRFYQRKFKAVVVDEYQDTNYAQNELIKLLSGGYRNLCVVGDDDQSIYKFRGAVVANIIGFSNAFKDAKVIRLEQNYRSTKTVLAGANSVIAKNETRLGKTLWTENETGGKIICRQCADEYDEGRFVADEILRRIKDEGRRYGDFAVLYRANALSSAVESALLKNGVPYKVFSGTKFYERAEVKDFASYLCVVVNHADSLRLKRIINTPKRGIGDATVDSAEALAAQRGESMYAVLKNADSFMQLERVKNKLAGFVSLIEELTAASVNMTITDFAKHLLERTGLLEYVVSLDRADGRDRASNLEMFVTNIANYEDTAENPTLTGFLEEAALSAELDNLSEDGSYVALMTLHGAKGLEFPVVIIVGMEEEIFPSSQSIVNQAELEEERRLAYVGYTRAKKQLILCHAEQRRTYKGLKRNVISRFVEDIPEQLIEKSVSERCFGGDFTRSERARSKAIYDPRRFVEKQPVDQKTYAPGDAVTHPTFGDGMVLKAQSAGGDTLLEVAFEKVGTKKLLANYARLEKR